MYFSIAIQLAILYTIQSAPQNGTQACNSCCTPGIHGIPGNHDAPGPGMKGDVGPKGDIGNHINDGRDGAPGKAGPKGEIGLQGQNGFQGKKGEKGEQAATTISQRKSAFSVAFKVDPGSHHISPMKYETIFTNIGSGYSKETGKFVCQYPGTYVFQVSSLKSSGRGKFLTILYKNGISTVSARADADGYNSASNMVVLDLVAGDQVWTQPLSTLYNSYYSSMYAYCSFSGFLLYAA